jgi:NhaP-type Na+/H+ or K+/H+ antiporter
VAQKVLLAWLAPRGIVTAAVASLFTLRLDEAGVPGASQLQGLVFLTILMTVGIQGLTAAPLARWLGLVSPPESGPEAGQGAKAEPDSGAESEAEASLKA